MNKTDLSRYNNSWFAPTVGASAFKRALWYSVSWLVFESSLFPFSGLKVLLLRWFGCQLGSGIVIKPRVQIKYPWLLSIGHHSWIGEGVWIDNLCSVRIGDHCCLSQAAYILTGNHNYRKSAFDLMVAPVTLEDGVWIGAKSVVCPGVTCASHSILTVGSIATKNLSEYTIYQGNPAQPVRKREIQ